MYVCLHNVLGPAAYMLPLVVGPQAVGKTSLPSYTMVSRRSYGSFHDDLQRVCQSFATQALSFQTHTALIVLFYLISYEKMLSMSYFNSCGLLCALNNILRLLIHFF